jgi:hypothetical protein
MIAERIACRAINAHRLSAPRATSLGARLIGDHSLLSSFGSVLPTRSRLTLAMQPGQVLD